MQQLTSSLIKFAGMSGISNCCRVDGAASKVLMRLGVIRQTGIQTVLTERKM
jgi:hypothetical protein